LRRLCITTCLLLIAGSLLSGCRTVIEPQSERIFLGTGDRPGPVIPVPDKLDDTLRSSNYKYIAALPKEELDRIMAAMDQYHLLLFKAIGPGRKELPEYANVIIVESQADLTDLAAEPPDTIVDEDAVAVSVAKRLLIVLHDKRWKEFSRRLFRAQARLFFADCLPGLPVWLQEGMVSFFEETTLAGIGGETKLKIIGYNGAKLSEVQELIRSGNLPTLAETMAIAQRGEFDAAHRLAAWAFVYWSQLSGKPSQQTFTRYVRDIKDQGAENVNIEEYLQTPLGAFDTKWREWLLKQEVYLTGDDKGKSSEREQ
jgi:hypothetical protein